MFNHSPKRSLIEFSAIIGILSGILSIAYLFINPMGSESFLFLALAVVFFVIVKVLKRISF